MEFIDNEASDDDDDSGDEEEVTQWTQADRNFIDDSRPSFSMLTKRKFQQDQQDDFEDGAKRLLSQLQHRKKIREMEEEASRVPQTPSITSYFAPKDTTSSRSEENVLTEENEENVLALKRRRMRRILVRWQVNYG